jgi:hypothetical protein
MNNTLKNLFEKTEEEYSNFPAVFESLKKSIFQKNNLVTRMARHPLFEIEPFESLLRNEFMTEEEQAALFLSDEKDINSGSEKLYTFTIDPETNQILHRIQYDENNNFYETIFWYEDSVHKSMERYVHTTFPYHHGSICYTFFKNEQPDLYIKCKYSKIKSKKYQISNGQIISYHEQDTESSYTSDVLFEYGTSGNIDLIKKYVKGAGIPQERPEILFKRPEAHQTIKSVFTEIENFLVARITEQIQQHVRIQEEVYCLMLEYCMPEAFPPHLAIGVTPDLEGPYETLKLYQLYNTPDLRYAYEENALRVDLYEEEMQYKYLFYYRAYDFKEYKREKFEYWNDQVRQVYVNVCKRLMHADFSTCFNISEHYLVIARGDVHDDTEYYYERMKAYKKI